MSKLLCFYYILISVMVILVCEVAIIDGISAGCPLLRQLCVTYCQRNRFGQDGKCMGGKNSECKCYVKPL
uniref:Putative Potassium channel toxin n=1 Tax=Megacormus gertschi TaxID=1843536 RepID=A0A224XGT0_9SCOR